MLDLTLIRNHPDVVRAGLARRGPAVADLLDLILLKDKEHRAYLSELQEKQSERNRLSDQIGGLMKAGKRDEADALKTQVSALKRDIDEIKELADRMGESLHDRLASLPNIPAANVPDGLTEEDNVVLDDYENGTKPTFSFVPKEHFDLGVALGDLDFETAASMSGSRFAIVSGELARLERALGQFMIDQHVEWNGYREVNPPALVRKEAMYGTGQLPKFAEDLFMTTDGRYLIPTAEVSLTNMVAGKIIDEPHPLMRWTALTQCFRAEAGSAGRDTHGLIRQHQFAKVELVSISGAPVVTFADGANEEHLRMLGAAMSVLKKLGLHFRVVHLCAGDMGFSAQSTYDIEVWLPGQNAYREISSVSYCGDFQARRMNARYRPTRGENQTAFLHTFNGSGVAVGRALVAVMENYQNEDGTINVPDALVRYMGGERDEKLVIGRE